MADILSSISILVAILTSLFGIFYPEIKKVLDLMPEGADTKQNNKANYQNAISVRNNKVWPIFAGSILLTLVFLPEFLHEIVNAWTVFKGNNYSFNFDQYDTVSAAYILTTLFAISLTAAVIITSFAFFGQVKKLRWK